MEDKGILNRTINYYMDRKQKFDNFLSVIFGICSVIGLGINIIFTYVAYKNESTTSYREIILSLGFSTIILTLVFVIVSYYYLRKLSELTNLNNEINDTINKNKRNEILIKNTSEIINNLAYYQRHIINKMDYFLENTSTANQETVKKISDDFKKFLSTFTSNLQTHFTLLTSDNCAITIKVVKDGKIKTFHRDAINYRLRKNADTSVDGKDVIYRIQDNFAFLVIHSKDYKETYYFCDDLKNDKQYFNTNPHWRNFYNATVVAPISINIGKLKNELLGFLCVDNFNGNLAQKPVEGILNASSALLFPVFHKYEKISTFANSKNYLDGRIQFFTYWGNS